MARTKASVGAKVSSGKSSKVRSITVPAPSYSGGSGVSERSSNKHSGGNSVCPRETPAWQKPITSFFVGHHKEHDTSQHDTPPAPGPSKPAKKRVNVIESEDEADCIEELPKNTELEESFSLTPLDGEQSHKIPEYLAENKENMDTEGETSGNKRKSAADHSGENSHSKRIKIDS